MNPRRVAAWPFDLRRGDPAANLELAREGLSRAAEAGAALLVLPEKWTTSYQGHYDRELRRASDEALAALHGEAAERGVTVLGSALGGDGDRPFNELHVLGASGDLRPYRKRMLFSPMDESGSCAPGDAPPEVVDTPVGRVAGVVCYDMRFPEITRAALLAEADLLVAPSEWPEVRSSALELLTRARALENQCWVLSCNRAGAFEHDGHPVAFPGTALLADPLGREAARSDGGELLVAELDPELTADVRRRIPCLHDLRAAGLDDRFRPA